jgi:hypothetical protein
MGTLPETVCHADWSLHAGKRWMATAQLEGGRYAAQMSRPVPDTALLLRDWRRKAADGGLVAGFDFPIGLPRRYAQRWGVTRFRDFLGKLAVREAWRSFADVATCEADISLQRPFFPARAGAKGEVTQSMLCRGLGVAEKWQLLRVCERKTATRPAAECMFWTLGPKQVGKAMLSGWQELLLPALKGPGQDRFRLWPFDGTLPELAGPGQAVLLEAYPGEMYAHFGVRGNGKTSQSFRREAGARMLDWAQEVGVDVAPELRRALEDGFGPGREPEDAFDAAVGLFGMLNVLLGRREDGCPADVELRELEGWILGQRP